MLVGMDVSNRSEIWRAAVDVCEIYESVRRSTAATGSSACNSAFVQIDRPGVQVCRLPIGHCSQLQVVNALCRSAASQQIATSRDAGFIELAPDAAAAGALPDALV